jgi:hypothetical protein
MRKIVLESLGAVFFVAITAAARAQVPATGANQNFPIKPFAHVRRLPAGGAAWMSRRGWYLRR